MPIKEPKGTDKWKWIWEWPLLCGSFTVIIIIIIIISLKKVLAKESNEDMK